MSEYNESEWSEWIRRLPGAPPPDLPSGEKIQVLCANGREPGRAEIVSYWTWDSTIHGGYEIIAYKRRKSAIAAHPEPTPEPAKIDDGGPAFPVGSGDMRDPTGMSLRQYAAIKLRVPNSGTDWLDAMILEAKRDELAAQILPAMYEGAWAAIHEQRIQPPKSTKEHFAALSSDSYQMANAMIDARSAK